jgi:hypothetical protein
MSGCCAARTQRAQCCLGTRGLCTFFAPLAVAPPRHTCRRRCCCLHRGAALPPPAPRARPCSPAPPAPPPPAPPARRATAAAPPSARGTQTRERCAWVQRGRAGGSGPCDTPSFFSVRVVCYACLFLNPSVCLCACVRVCLFWRRNEKCCKCCSSRALPLPHHAPGCQNAHALQASWRPQEDASCQW